MARKETKADKIRAYHDAMQDMRHDEVFNALCPDTKEEKSYLTGANRSTSLCGHKACENRTEKGEYFCFKHLVSRYMSSVYRNISEAA